ncbi:MAG TPA: RDD family protein [Kofleriaceae bacterium]|nr:RDD family protein [Kofleriaceae bacterium]
MTEAEPAILGASRDRSLPTAHAVSMPVRPRASAPTVHVAGMWRRAAAGLVDLAILAPIVVLLVFLASRLTGARIPASRASLDFWLDLLLTSDPAVLSALVIAAATGLLYLFVFQATIAQTIGMRLLKLRVIDVYGDPPSYARAGVRTAAYLASIATLFLGFWWIGFDAEKRGLHDWIAGTYVIRG